MNGHLYERNICLFVPRQRQLSAGKKHVLYSPERTQIGKPPSELPTSGSVTRRITASQASYPVEGSKDGKNLWDIPTFPSAALSLKDVDGRSANAAKSWIAVSKVSCADVTLPAHKP